MENDNDDDTEHQQHEEDPNKQLSNFLIRRCGNPPSINTSSYHSDKQSPLYSWTVRDAIYSILLSSSSSSTTTPSSLASSIITPVKKSKTSKKVPLSGNFSVSNILDDIKSNEDKIDVVRAAFEAAALAIVRGLSTSKSVGLDGKRWWEQQQHDHNHHHEYNDPHHSNDENNDNYIPPLVNTLVDIGKSRDVCIKAASGKKGLWMDALANSNNLSSSAKKRKVPGGGGGGGSGGGLSGGKDYDNDNDHKRRKSDASSSLQSSSKPDHATSSSTTTGGGGGTTPTVTTSAAKTTAAPSTIDSRATVARAILCAAASVAFKDLTPDILSDDGAHVENAIDPLDVPQNTLHNKSSSSNGETSDKEGKKVSSTSLSTTTQQQQQQPVVNMGAVMMQAKTLGKRAVSHALGAAKRGARRREFRCDVAFDKIARCNDGFRSCVVQSSSFYHFSSGGKRKKSKSGGAGELHMITDGSDDSSSDDSSSSSHNSHDDAHHCNTSSKSSMVHSIKPAQSLPLIIPNPFRLDGIDSEHYPEEEDVHTLDLSRRRLNLTSSGSSSSGGGDGVKKEEGMASEWSGRCLPRLLSILETGAGHAILYDVEWRDRAGRISDLLRHLAIGTITTTKNSNDENASGNNTNIKQEKKEEQEGFSTSICGSKSGVRGYPNYGPHLIVTTQVDFDSFESAFDQLGCNIHVYDSKTTKEEEEEEEGDTEEEETDPEEIILRVFSYTGTNKRRRALRQHFHTSHTIGGLKDSPYHIILTTYKDFVSDYVHFCQIPFQVVVMDDGMSWLGCAHFDSNGKLGKVWDNGVWSRGDDSAGLAGVNSNKWDFSADGYVSPDSSDDETSRPSEEKREGMLIGLTARHRLLLASSLHSKHRGTVYPAPVPALLSFLLPQFSDVVREEWDRSRVYNCPLSMDHMRRLLARGVVVYTGTEVAAQYGNLLSLALLAMEGTLSYVNVHAAAEEEYDESEVVAHAALSESDVVTTDRLISEGKVVQSRRFASSWLRPSSPIRHELGSISLEPILSAIDERNSAGYVCEEVVTASSITSSGAGGTVSGPSAYKVAVRCGRTFGSEQGLRQHMAALHAPPGTWLCRSCGGDCGTSQARTHHERYCGTATAGGSTQGGAGGGVPTVGQGIGSMAGSKQQKGQGGASGGKPGVASSGVGASDKDEDGSFRVPGYRGVWVKPSGKYFVKVDGSPLAAKEKEGNSKQNAVKLFDSAEDAAHKYDDEVKLRGKSTQSTEMNYKSDGSRIVYEDSVAGTAAGRGVEMLGGGASSVVPALSVINIKDLPKHVKPLLRDPKQTSRTGGNSKRYVYAYRGVCRQARKGHDRWQSQISFGGTNHYLGTFDSEWDAAAIYAWAHLILYGEEATKKAQREGEEAAAAYEQEKKDIAAGKIIAPAPKTAKKKKKPPAKKGSSASAGSTKDSDGKKKDDGSGKNSGSSKADNKSANKSEKHETRDPLGSGDSSRGADGAGKANKKRPLKLVISGRGEGAKPGNKGDSSSIGEKSNGVLKAPKLSWRNDFSELDDESLVKMASGRIMAFRNRRLQAVGPSSSNPISGWSICLPMVDSQDHTPLGCAMLFGLSPDEFGWNANLFISTLLHESEEVTMAASAAIHAEFGVEGLNVSFRTIMRGSPCVLGRAGRDLEDAFVSLGLEGTMLGGTLGHVDCNVGGEVASCSARAAQIEFSPADGCDYRFSACNDDDIVTLNGKQITASMGALPLKSGDICSVGARVFLFIQPSL